MVEPPASQENKQLLQNQDWNIQILLRKLKQSQREEVSLSSTLEIEMRYKEEIQTKYFPFLIPVSILHSLKVLKNSIL